MFKARDIFNDGNIVAVKKVHMLLLTENVIISHLMFVCSINYYNLHDSCHRLPFGSFLGCLQLLLSSTVTLSLSVLIEAKNSLVQYCLR